MIAKKNQSITIPYITVFTGKYIIEEKYNFLLNSIEIYACDKISGRLGEKVDFDIWVTNNQKIIVPLKRHDQYVLFGIKYITDGVVLVSDEKFSSFI